MILDYDRGVLLTAIIFLVVHLIFGLNEIILGSFIVNYALFMIISYYLKRLKNDS
jgi:hypothetical protein